MYVAFANAVLILHVAFIAFVVLLVPMVYIGRAMGWSWVRGFWLRVAHLVCIGIVVWQAWAGVICPLTTLEMWLRENGEITAYSGGFIEYWLQRLIYWNFPEWVFIVIYSVFALLVCLTWYVVPPIRGRGFK